MRTQITNGGKTSVEYPSAFEIEQTQRALIYAKSTRKMPDCFDQEAHRKRWKTPEGRRAVYTINAIKEHAGSLTHELSNQAHTAFRCSVYMVILRKHLRAWLGEEDDTWWRCEALIQEGLYEFTTWDQAIAIEAGL